MKLRFMEGSRTGRLVEVASENFTIGRDLKCDLMLDDDGISRQHCKISRDGVDFMVEDLGSTNGVYLNGKKIEGRTKLQLNDKLRIGSVLLLFTDATGILDPEEVKRLEDAIKKNLADKEAETSRQQAAAEAKAEARAKAKAEGRAAKPKGNTDQKPDVASKAVTAVFVGIMVVLAGLLLLMLLAPGEKDKGEPPKSDNNLVQNPLPDTPPAGDDDDDVAPVPGDDDDPGVNPNGNQPPPAARPTINYYWVRSQPEGAVAFVDGEEVGLTPVMVTGLPRGAHQLKLSKDGYREMNRIFHIPFDGEFFDYQLELEPGVCLITSDPTGMAIKRGPQVIGYTPYLFRGESGTHELRMAGAGFAAVPFAVRISKAVPTREHIQLRPAGAALQVISLPAGAKVFVDGLLVGTTEARDRGESDPLTVPDLLPGTHKVQLEFQGKQSEVRTVKLDKGETGKVGLLIYRADTEVTTRDGKKQEGMFIRKKANGDVMMATEDGRTLTIKEAEIQLLQPLGGAGEAPPEDAFDLPED